MKVKKLTLYCPGKHKAVQLGNNRSRHKSCRCSFKETRQFNRPNDALNQKLGMSYKEVVLNPKRKMGHAFVLAMMLDGVLDDVLKEVSNG